MVREREPRRNGRRRPSKQHPLRVLFASDGTPVSEAALWRMIELLGEQEAEVSVLSVADEPVGGPLSPRDARAASHRAADILSNHGLAATSKVRAGAAAPLIVAEAEEAEVDLVVLGSRGVRRWDERNLGSVALEMARSTPCSVLIVREAVTESAREAPAPEAPAVRTPFDIAYRNLRRSRTIEEHVLRGIGRLERVNQRLLRCRVTVELRHPRHKSGNLYHVRLDLMLPDHEIVVSRTPPAHTQSEEVVNAIGEAFDSARRRLVEAGRRQHGEVKTHEPPAHGRVRELLPDHGFIEAVDGRTVYFHRNAVPNDGFDEMDLGSEVRFVEEMGVEGPQASTVTLVGKHHLVG
jgi:nucleotide-binding universal stress UspA family protein/cold shock CspA family protein